MIFKALPFGTISPPSGVLACAGRISDAEAIADGNAPAMPNSAAFFKKSRRELMFLYYKM